MDIKTQTLAKIASYFSIISNTNGRLRVRVSSKIKELDSTINLSQIDEMIAKINGIKSVKFNKIIGSVTIEYDHTIFSKDMWEDLLKGRNLDKISTVINEVAREVYCA
ncbi:hypothetical protein KDD93_03720 [Campylobacter sp. faydin G-24]|uniref:Cation transporter n=1 Tax=Campylobacter anatolicus TaxID=2829105 RepID=A0ABS5HHT7_9BACT|nr:hypothetical protein [Campylobacter anatolicus]MBR8462201.1 hypothetical protein [Campylobacter anatolicus]MBR8463682.1 hypothetical protein [Campylobacter anatolicus]MBR8466405.1 hypothetical protein [Campylobacter anatolicus]